MKMHRKNRGLRLEFLERRQLFAGDVSHNFLLPHDVNDDSKVTAMDALTIINHVNRRESGMADDRLQFFDVNDDTRVTPLDALQIINGLNRRSERPAASNVDAAVAILFDTSGLRAKAEYELESGSRKLEIRVHGGAANESYNVSIGQVELGTLTTDSRGRGRLDFEPQDDSSLPFPSNIPDIVSGVSFALEGVGESFFSALGRESGDDGSSSNGGDDGGSGGDGTGSNTSVGASELTARLTGIRSLSGRAKIEISSRQSEFEVELENAPVNTTYSVEIDGIVVGNLTTDRRGRGQLAFESTDRSKPFPADFPTIGVGSIVRIGTVITGTFAKSSQDD